jgi:hypothetical protein
MRGFALGWLHKTNLMRTLSSLRKFSLVVTLCKKLANFDFRLAFSKFDTSAD